MRIILAKKNKNMFITGTDFFRQTICKCSTGLAKFKGPKRKTWTASKAVGKRFSKMVIKSKYRFLFIIAVSRTRGPVKFAVRGFKNKKVLPMLFYFRKPRRHSRGKRQKKFKRK